MQADFLFQFDLNSGMKGLILSNLQEAVECEKV